MLRRIALMTLLVLVVSNSADAGIFRKRRLNSNQVVWNPQTGRYQTYQVTPYRTNVAPRTYRYAAPPVRTYAPAPSIPARPQTPMFPPPGLIGN
jgi:hypothetical protein